MQSLVAAQSQMPSTSTRPLRHLAVPIVALCIAGSIAQAQIYDPVQWKLEFEASEARPGQTLLGRLTAEIQDGWHAYSTTTPEGIPLDIFVAESEAVSGWRAHQPEPEVVFDPNFEAEVEWYTGEVEFLIELDIAASAAGQHDVEVKVLYGACDPRQCLPPKRKSARASFTVSSTASAEAVEIPAGYQPAQLNGTANRAAPSSTLASAGGAAPADFRSEERGIVGFSLLALGVGFLAILTPCVFPMIPIYIGAFLDGGERRWSSVLKQAGTFCLGVIILFTAIGGALSAIVGPFGTSQIGSSPWVNLLIATVMFTFALSMFGAFEFTLPSSWTTGASSKSSGSGTASTLMLSLVFTLASFACTGPFMGSLLAGSVASGGAAYPVIGMAMFSTGLAAPFFLLALFPALLNRLPRSGGWLSTSKRTAGFVIAAVGLKYLGNVDQVFGWQVLTRERFLALWIVLFACAGLYLWGLLRLRDDLPGDGVGLGRLGAGALFVAFAVSLAPGLVGGALGELEAHIPAAANSSIAGQQPGELSWLKDDYDGALATAESEDRVLFVSFTGYACSNCKWMKANMFTKPEVSERLAEMVRVELYTDGFDASSERYQEFQIERFRSTSIPFYALVSPDGSTVATFSGQTRDVAGFLGFLAAAG